MRKDQTFDNIKNALNGRPGQPIVFGVCKALAARFGCEPWITRGITIVLTVFLTLPTLAAYILLGVCLPETEARTKGFFSGLTVLFREWTEKFCTSSKQNYHSDDYNGGYR